MMVPAPSTTAQSEIEVAIIPMQSRRQLVARSRSGDARLGTSAVEVTPDMPFTGSNRVRMAHY
jgi:hypothetical protein